MSTSRTLRTVCALAVFTLLLSGCSSEETSPPAQSPSAQSPSTQPSGTQPASGKPTASEPAAETREAPEEAGKLLRLTLVVPDATSVEDLDRTLGELDEFLVGYSEIGREAVGDGFSFTLVPDYLRYDEVLERQDRLVAELRSRGTLTTEAYFAGVFSVTPAPGSGLAAESNRESYMRIQAATGVEVASGSGGETSISELVFEKDLADAEVEKLRAAIAREAGVAPDDVVYRAF